MDATRHRRTASLAKTLLCKEEKQAFYLVAIMALVNQVTITSSCRKLIALTPTHYWHAHNSNTRTYSTNQHSEIIVVLRKCLKLRTCVWKCV